MLPIEQVQRRIATGSYNLKKHPEVSEFTRFDPVLVETFLKDDVRDYPQVLPDDIVKMGYATIVEVDWMAREGQKVFEVLERAWSELVITLVDLKIEFGRDAQGRLMVADVIDNDSWRLWLNGDKNQMLDKQVYRGLGQVTKQDLEQIAKNYDRVAELTSNLRFVP